MSIIEKVREAMMNENGDTPRERRALMGGERVNPEVLGLRLSAGQRALRRSEEAEEKEKKKDD